MCGTKFKYIKHATSSYGHFKEFLQQASDYLSSLQITNSPSPFVQYHSHQFTRYQYPDLEIWNKSRTFSSRLNPANFRCTVTQFPDKEQCLSNKTRYLPNKFGNTGCNLLPTVSRLCGRWTDSRVKWCTRRHLHAYNGKHLLVF